MLFHRLFLVRNVDPARYLPRDLSIARTSVRIVPHESAANLGQLRNEREREHAAGPRSFRQALVQKEIVSVRPDNASATWPSKCRLEQDGRQPRARNARAASTISARAIRDRRAIRGLGALA